MLYVRVTAADSTGSESLFSNELEIVVPGAVGASTFGVFESGIALHQNRPNPFAPFTTISFAVAEQGLVDLSVYDVRGRLVRTLIHDEMVTRLGEVVWDGTDTRRRHVGSGVYFYRLRIGDEEMTKRMVLRR